MSSAKPESVFQAVGHAEWLELVRRPVASLRYGVVQIVMHDSKVAQIERTQRFRLEPSPGQNI